MALVTTPAASSVIGCALRVHRALGPGLFESIYERCLSHEFGKAGMSFRRQVSLPVTYDGLDLGRAFCVDFIVEESVVVEIKSVETILPVHSSQVLTYLKLSGLRKGLLINFNAALLKDGIRSFVM
jgi:GxxExxY protein